MWPPRGIEPREGAELSKRVSVCQRSSQGAQAPQRSVRAARGRDSLPRHLELTRTSAKGSFSFTEGSCGNCIPEFGFRAGCAFRFEPVWESVDRNPAGNGTCFPFAALGGNCVPDPALRTGCIFRLRPRTENASQSLAKKRGALFGRLLPAHACILARHLGPVCPDIPPTFAPLCRPFGRLSAHAGILKTILFLCNTMQVRPARFEGGP